jgi:membrane protein DedA with SNARE-associated domain
VKVVFFGRFVTVLRTYAAFLAGLSTMRWSRFLVANAAGGVLWSGIYAFGAYALGNAASSIGSTITIAGLAVAGVLTAATIVIGRRSLRRIEQQAEDAFPHQPAPLPRRRAGQHDQPGAVRGDCA